MEKPENGEITSFSAPKDKGDKPKENMNITEAMLSPMDADSCIWPFSFSYTQAGVRKTKELMNINDSVAVILFNSTTKKLIFLKQFRPAVYIATIDPKDRSTKPMDTKTYPISAGITLEICASVITEEISMEDLACEQIFTKCGYRIRLSDLKKVYSFRAGVDYLGSQQTLFYCKVCDEMKSTDEGALGDDSVQVVEMSIPEVEEYLNNPSQEPLPCPPSCLFAIMWFLRFKAKKYRD